MDVKSHVALLHDFLLKQGEIPEYKLVYDGSGTRDPLFQYDVMGRGKVASGKGNTKKEARQNAARLLLLQLQEETSEEAEVNVFSPYDQSPRKHAVGSLMDFCSMHNIALPKYELIRDEGLSHAKVFGIRCTVSSFTTVAESRTKKQAKQQASYLMMKKLKKCLHEESSSCSNSSEDGEEITANGCGATKKETSAHVKDMISGFRLGTFFNNYSEHFLDTVAPLSECLQSIANREDSFFEEHENPEQLLDTILKELGYNYSYGSLESTSENFLAYVHIRELNTTHFIGMGNSESTAKKNSAIKALQFMATMSRA